MSRKMIFAIVLAASTMLSAVGLVATGGWLISSAALMPPILTLQVAIVAVRFFGIARGTARWAERVVSHDVALAGTTDARVKLWLAAAVLGPRGVWRLRGSDALDRLTADTDALQDDVTRVRTPFVAAAVSAVLLVLFQFLYLPVAGVMLAVAFVVAGVFVPLMTVRVETAIAREAVAARNEISTHVASVVAHADDLRLQGATESVLAELAAADARRVAIESRASRWAGVSSWLTGCVTGLALFTGLGTAIAAFEEGGFDGRLIAVIALLPWASAEITASFAQAVTARTRVVQARTRIEELLGDADAVTARAHAPSVQVTDPQVLSVRNLYVRWTDRDVVADKSFKVRRGEVVALVGPSGSGKSSIAAAVLRLVEHRGEISLDGVAIEDVIDYRKHVTALLQTTHVFTTTLRENLRVANPMASDDELVAALRRAGLREWFDGLSLGLDTPLGARVRSLSGGETQRLGIARVLLTSAEFVILDEPTEHLDAESAAAIWTTLQEALADRGILLITHDWYLHKSQVVLV